MVGSTVAALAMVVGMLVGQPAMALQLDPAVAPGRLMPLFPSSPGGIPVDAGAPGYVGYDVEQGAEYETSHYQIRRTTDGAVVRTLPRGNTQLPLLSAGGLVALQPIPGQVGGTRVVVTDVETGAITWTVDVPSNEHLVWPSALWVLSTQDSYGGGQAVLRRPGQEPLVVPGLSFVNPSPQFQANATTLVIHDMGNIWTIDLATGALHQLTGSAGSNDNVELTPQRVFWIAPGAMQSANISWADIDGSNPGSVVAPDGGLSAQWIGFGNRLAMLVYEPGDGTYSAHLEPIDLSTGVRQSAVADHVGTIQSGNDGTVTMMLRDTPTGRVATVADDGQPAHPVADFPVIGEQATALGLSGGHLFAGFGWTYDPGAGPVMTTPTDGSGTWDSSLAAGDVPLPGALVAARGDVVQTQTSHSYPALQYTVSWPGGHRDLTQAPGGWTLARGGQVLIGGTGSYALTLADTRTGASLGTVPYDSSFAVDGRTLWQGPDASGNLVATDLDGATPARTVPTGLTSCTYPSLQVADRFALVMCGDTTYTAIDLDGVLTPQTLAWARANDSAPPQLGDGFVAWTHQLTDPAGVIYQVAQVQDLGPGHGTHLYGPLHGLYSPPLPMMTVDDADNPRLAYVDNSELPRVVDLDWLTPAPTTWQDTAAPTLGTVTGSPRVAGPSLTASWSATDSTDAAGQYPSGVASYDVRYQQGPVAGPYGDWVQPPALQATTATTTTLTGPPGQDTCISVRATDRAGNTSAWSAPRCTAVDGAAPTLTGTAGSPRTSPVRQLTFSWAFTDPALAGTVPGSGLGSYDVRYQQAPKVGAPYGAWTAPTSWQRMSAANVALSANPGVDTCFQVRARDKVGNTSPWSASRCSSVDGTAPTLVTATAGPLVVSTVTNTAVTFSYKATDNLALASYDVGYRYAPPGAALGALIQPAGWQATTSTTEKATFGPGGEVCFVVRARDRAGNLSPWSAPHCATVPYDDRALTGSWVTRGTSSLALAGTVTKLNGTGATVRTGWQRGTRVALVVIRGPRQGAVDVYAGSHYLGRVYLAATTWHRDIVLLPAYTFTNATVTIRSVSSAPSLIDALALTR